MQDQTTPPTPQIGDIIDYDGLMYRTQCVVTRIGADGGIVFNLRGVDTPGWKAHPAAFKAKGMRTFYVHFQQAVLASLPLDALLDPEDARAMADIARFVTRTVTPERIAQGEI